MADLVKMSQWHISKPLCAKYSILLVVFWVCEEMKRIENFISFIQPTYLPIYLSVGIVFL